ncbi:MAG: hypothetical protein CL840_07495 [Crocinitomicaceae bacterium]|nr:hypothetical protein [Crocinitomicaceae bacterium]|tara:strand:- start:5993 stop:6589 length:597 start_codon:yes stop_codon:yes gene_type:complete
MKGAKNADEFYSRSNEWSETLNLLREVLCSFNELEETIKWGVPAYILSGKICIGVAAFKNYAALWFHQGALLEDKANVLVNAQEGKTKALRQWRFPSIDAVDKELIKNYVAEAIANQKAGREIKPSPKKEVAIPAELSAAFKLDKDLKSSFEQLSKSCQREYLEYIGEAKKEETRLRRLEKCIPMILEGKGVYDKYKK